MIRVFVFALCLLLWLAPFSAVHADGLTVFPARAAQSCNFGRAKLYDECGNQTGLFESALSEARRSGKVLLVSYGAEWCIWCHVFDQYLAGQHTLMQYQYGDPGARQTASVLLMEKPKSDPRKAAERLERFAAERFVLVHIENYHAPGGKDVLKRTGAAAHFSGAIPFVFTVTSSGAFAAALESEKVETRRDTADWYRGYDRARLLNALGEMARAASK